VPGIGQPAPPAGGLRTRRCSGAAGTSTYLRFAFTGTVDERIAGRPLDRGIVRTLWLTVQEVKQRSALWRSPLVPRCVDDYLAGRRFPLDALYTHPGVAAASSGAGGH
jgi:hypothetical protein